MSAVMYVVGIFGKSRVFVSDEKAASSNEWKLSRAT